MGDLTDHFSRSEFACPCGCGYDTPVPALVFSLEMLRSIVRRPILIKSGCRCATQNERAGGDDKSQHLLGTAADIAVADYPLIDLYRDSVGVPEFFSGGVGVYPDKGIVHVDVRGHRARWGELAGKRCSAGDAIEELKRRGG